jgi:hypothetical protein
MKTVKQKELGGETDVKYMLIADRKLAEKIRLMRDQL